MDIRKILPVAGMLWLLGAAPIAAAPNTWTPTGPNGTPLVQVRFAPSNPQRAYAVGNGGVFRSDDAGLTWHHLFEGPANSMQRLSVDALDADTFLVGGGGEEVYLSVDGGTTFSLLPNALSTSQYLGLAIRGQTIYVGGNGKGIAVSTDGGQTFANRSNGLPPGTWGPHPTVYSLHVDPRNALVAYAEFDGAPYYRTTDGGLNWQVMNATPYGGFGAQLTLSTAAPDQLYTTSMKSLDGGASWQASGGSSGNFTIASHTGDPNQVVEVSNFNPDIQLTLDGGQSWLWRDVPSAGQAYGIALAGSPTTILVAHGRGLSRSTDNGLTWHPGTGIKGGMVEFLTSDPTDPARLYIGIQGKGLARSEDGGRTWTDLTDALLARATYNAIMVYAVAVDPFDSMTIYAGSHADGLRRSRDRGATWTTPSQALVETGVYDILIHPHDSNHLLIAAGADGVRRSLDGGTTWQTIQNGLTGQFIHKLVRHPTRPDVLFAAAFGNASFRSTDGGLTWSLLPLQGFATRFYDLEFDAADADLIRIYTGQYQNAVQISRDGGATWAVEAGYLCTGARERVNHPSRPEVVVIAGTGGVCRSGDGGTNWQRLDLGRTETFSRWALNARFDATDPTRLLAAFYNGGLRALQLHADLQPTLTLPGTSVVSGQEYRVTIMVRNAGTEMTAGVRADLQLPVGTTMVRAETSPFTCAGTSTISCRLGLLAAGSTQRVVLVLRSDTPGVGMVSMDVSSADHDPAPSDNAINQSFDVRGRADLGVSLTVPAGRPLSGANTPVTASIDNAGPHTATALTLTLSLPDGASIASATGATCAQVGASATCTGADLASGTSRSVGLDLVFLNPGENVFTAGVSANQTDLVATNNAGTATFDVRGRADLRMRFSAPSPAEITTGQRATYDSVVTNLGPDPATGVAINYTLPSGASSVGATGATCQTSGVTVGCTVATLPSGNSVAIPVAMNLSTTGTMTLSGSVTASEADADTGNNADSSSVGVSRPTTGSDLTVAVTGGAASLQVNKTTTYSFSVTNTGPQATTGGTFTFTVPALLTGSSIKADKPIKCTKGAVMRCTLTAMTVGQTVRGTIKLKAKKTPGTATMTATVTGSPADFDSTNNTVTRSVTITPKP